MRQLVIALCVFGFSVIPSKAAIVSVAATGNIDVVDAAILGNGLFEAGDSFSLSFRYDDQAADAIPDSSFGLFDALLSWSLRFGTYEVTLAPTTNIVVQDNDSFVGDGFFAGVISDDVVSGGGTVNGLAFNQSSLSLEDASQTALLSDALNGLLLNLNDFATLRIVSILFLESLAPNQFALRGAEGTISSLRVTTSEIPLPAAAPLMVFGLIGLGAYLRKQRVH